MPRLGIGMPLVSTATEAPVLAVQDFFWLNDISGELTPIHTASRTNLSTNNVTAWGTTNVTKIANDTTSPDGTENAARITATSITQPRTETGVSGGVPATDTTYTFSVFVKKGNTPYIALSRYSGSKYAIFNLDAKSVVSSDTENATIDEISNGWFKISITQTVLSTDSYNLWKVNLTNGTNQNTGVVGEYMYVWGGQVEQDSRVSAYIPTSGSAVTVTTPLNDTHNAWDYDSANLTLEEDPDSEGSWERPSNVVLNHDFADLGSELVDDSGFANGLDSWSNSGVTESGGVVTFDADAGSDYIFQDLSYTNDKVYAITLEGTGNAKIRVGYSGLGGTQVVIGALPVTLNLFVDSTANRIQIYKNSGDELLLTSVSVKQVDPNDRWTKNDSVSISGGSANFTGTAGHYLSQDILTSGTTYYLSFNVSAYTSGALTIFGGAPNNISSSFLVNSTGTYTGNFTAGGTNNKLYFGSGFTGSIDNITVKEYAAMPLDV
jgi:hypothetical protein